MLDLLDMQTDRSGQLGQANPSGNPYIVVGSDGIRKLTPDGNREVAKYLNALYVASQNPAPNGQAFVVLATKCEQAKQLGQKCETTAYNLLRTYTAPNVVIVDIAAVSPDAVAMTLTDSPQTIESLVGAAGASTNAIYDQNTPLPEKKEKKTGMAPLLAGVAAGGALGWAAGGPVGAVIGAAAGGAAVSWVA